MTQTETSITDLPRSAYETAWRDFWYAHVMIEAGAPPPPDFAHEKKATAPPR
jgi:hypothetical protein